MDLPLEIDVAVRAHAADDGRSRHRLKIELAKLVTAQAPPSSLQHLALAERFLEDPSNAGELAEARKDIWAHVGSLACHCTVSDSASSQAVLNCLETNQADHTLESLREHVFRVLQCDVPAAAVLGVLKSSSTVS